MVDQRAIAKAIMRNVVDACLMPGTANGIEIMWIYGKEWRSKISLVLVATLSLIFSTTAISFSDDTAPDNFNGQENIK